MCERKYNNIQIAENIFFYEDLHGVVINGKEIVIPHEPYVLLECLVRAKGRVVKADFIKQKVWENEAQNPEDEDRRLIDTVKRLRKILGDTKSKKTIIVAQRGVGYRLGRFKEMELEQSDALPIMLSSSSVLNTTTDTIIFREQELQELADLLLEKNTKTLLLHGFGGVGKTSLARLLYSRIKGNYDSTGWFEYHVSIKDTMAEGVDMRLFNNADVSCADNLEKKWLYISDLLKNTKERKLLVIDNVDIDNEISQNPIHDRFLQEISGWTNTDIILTSRLPEIIGYYPVQIENLGNVSDDEKCIGLFSHYNKSVIVDDARNLKAVRKLVELAGYNTMMIELLAKSCVYEESLESFIAKLKTIGFEYPQIPVMTMHGNKPDTAIRQLSKLFELRKRTETEKQIILCFRLLPEGEHVCRSELEGWLGFSLADVDQLIKEGWVNFSGGFFSIHPLIRQAVTVDDGVARKYRDSIHQKKMDRDNRNTIYSLLVRKQLFNDDENLEDSLRKLRFADCLSQPYDMNPLDVMIYLGDYSRKLGRRDLALKHYKMAYERVRSLYDVSSRKEEDSGEINNTELAWKATYYYGYLLSYTKNGMASAEKLIRESLKIAKGKIADSNREKKIMLLAASYDHLSYVLFNTDGASWKRLAEAKTLLEDAISNRVFLCNLRPDNIRYLHDLAWSQDNMGCLLTKMFLFQRNLNSPICDDLIECDDNKGAATIINMAEEYLRSSLDTRIKLAEARGNQRTSSEVAWTRCNLAVCLAAQDKNDEAEEMFQKSIEDYENIELKIPGLEAASLAKTYAAYARMICKIGDREDEGIEMLDKAMRLNLLLEKDHPGVYQAEIKMISYEIDAQKKSKTIKKFHNNSTFASF